MISKEKVDLTSKITKEQENQSNHITDLCGAPQQQVQEKPLQTLESGDLSVIFLILPGIAYVSLGSLLPSLKLNFFIYKMKKLNSR